MSEKRDLLNIPCGEDMIIMKQLRKRCNNITELYHMDNILYATIDGASFVHPLDEYKTEKYTSNDRGDGLYCVASQICQH